MSDSSRQADPAVGLCSVCRHGRSQPSAKGNTFWRCGRSDEDETFLRYPPLPVTECRGFERGAATNTG